MKMHDIFCARQFLHLRYIYQVNSMDIILLCYSVQFFNKKTKKEVMLV